MNSEFINAYIHNFLKVIDSLTREKIYLLTEKDINANTIQELSSELDTLKKQKAKKEKGNPNE